MNDPHPQGDDNPRRVAHVPGHCEGQRLDRFLADHFPRYSRKTLQRVIRAGWVRVNAERGKPGTLLRRGDYLELPILSDAIEKLESQRNRTRTKGQSSRELTQLYRDDDVIVINKPAGVSVHGGAGHEATIIDLMRTDVLADFGLVHRLDRDTTGALLLVRGTDARRRMMTIFSRDGLADETSLSAAPASATEPQPVTKTYTAIVSGHLDPRDGVIDLPLSPPVGRRRRTHVDYEHGKNAITKYETEEVFTRASRVTLGLRTGRTHQLRAHLQARGAPLLVDPLYGGRRSLHVRDPRRQRDLYLKRTPLHAARLTFPHPTRDCVIDVRAPLFEDMRYALELLRVITGRGLKRGGLPPQPFERNEPRGRSES